MFVVGDVRIWDPPRRLVVTWREREASPRIGAPSCTSASSKSATQTRVTVEHFGWDTIPQRQACAPWVPAGGVPAALRRVVADVAFAS